MTEYFIDPVNGSSGNDGLSRASAKASIDDFAVDGNENPKVNLSGGDIINLMDTGMDQPTGEVKFLDYNGTSKASPIHLRGDPQNSGDAIFDGSLGSQDNFFRHIECKYWKFSDFTIQNVDNGGMVFTDFTGSGGPTYGEHVFEDLLIENTGIDTPDRTGNSIFLARNTVNCELYRVRAINSSAYRDSDGFYIGGTQAAGLPGGHYFEDCEASYHADDGWDFFRSDPNNGSVMVGCIAHHNGHDKEAWDAGDTTGTVGAWGDGNGFKMGGELGGDNLCYRCISYKNFGRQQGGAGSTQGRGYDDNNASNPNFYYNCISWDNFSIGYRPAVNNPLESQFINCVAFDEVVDISGPQAATNNSWDTAGITVTSGDFQSLVEGSEAFLRTANGSDLQDAGLTLDGLTFNESDWSGYTIDFSGTWNISETSSGAGPDMGAREFLGTSNPTDSGARSTVSYSPVAFAGGVEIFDPPLRGEFGEDQFGEEAFGGIALYPGTYGVGGYGAGIYGPNKFLTQVVATTKHATSIADGAITDVASRSQAIVSTLTASETITTPQTGTIEDWEGTDPLSNYDGASNWQLNSTRKFEGTFSAQSTASGLTLLKRTNGVTNLGNTYSARLWQFQGTTGGLALCIQQSTTSRANLSGYEFRMDFGFTPELSIQRVDNGTATTLATTVLPDNGQPNDLREEWALMEATVGSSGSITVTLSDEAGNELHSVSTNDTTYTSGSWGIISNQSSNYNDFISVQTDVQSEAGSLTAVTATPEISQETAASDATSNLSSVVASTITTSQTQSVTDAAGKSSYVATTLSSAEEQPNVITSTIEDWEGTTPLNNYSGQTGSFEVQTSRTFNSTGNAARSTAAGTIFGGSSAYDTKLGADYEGHIWMFNGTFAAYLFMVQTDTTGSSDVSGYVADVDFGSTDELKLGRWDNGSFTELDGVSVIGADWQEDWMKIEFSVQTNGDISVTFTNTEDGTVSPVTLTANDTTYTSGRLGFKANESNDYFDELTETATTVTAGDSAGIVTSSASTLTSTVSTESTDAGTRTAVAAPTITSGSQTVATDGGALIATSASTINAISESAPTTAAGKISAAASTLASTETTSTFDNGARTSVAATMDTAIVSITSSAQLSNAIASPVQAAMSVDATDPASKSATVASPFQAAGQADVTLQPPLLSVSATPITSVTAATASTIATKSQIIATPLASAEFTESPTAPAGKITASTSMLTATETTTSNDAAGRASIIASPVATTSTTQSSTAATRTSAVASPIAAESSTTNTDAAGKIATSASPVVPASFGEIDEPAGKISAAVTPLPATSDVEDVTVVSFKSGAAANTLVAAESTASMAAAARSAASASSFTAGASSAATDVGSIITASASALEAQSDSQSTDVAGKITFSWSIIDDDSTSIGDGTAGALTTFTPTTTTSSESSQSTAASVRTAVSASTLTAGAATLSDDAGTLTAVSVEPVVVQETVNVGIVRDVISVQASKERIVDITAIAGTMQEDQDFTMVQGDTKVVRANDGIVDEDLGGFVNIANMDVVWKLGSLATGTTEVIKTESDGINVIQASNGRFEVNLDPSDTENIDGVFYHEAEVTDTSGQVTTVFSGYATIRKDLA